MVFQPIPKKYYELSEIELYERIRGVKQTLGERLVILGHHYQRDEVIQFADFRGDSLRLSQLAAGQPNADYIVFCGVHFMAETADILSAPHQKVCLPDLNAGCHMADMADLDSVEDSWEELTEVCGESIVPITYINSAADLKAFCGAHGGVVCTSSNAPSIMGWAFTQKEKVFFFPDEHLGRNTGVKHGIPVEEMILWDPQLDLGGHTPEEIENARIFLWKGNCPVHQLFTVNQIHRIRKQIPDIQVIVHPECRREVVELADIDGSTAFIIRTIEAAPAGSKWAVGTELHLVRRLAKEHPDKLIISVDPNMCLCTTMNRIDVPHVAWTLENLLDDEVVNHIVVTEEDAKWAKIALDRMLDLSN